MNQRVLAIGLILVVVVALIALVVAAAALGVSRHLRKQREANEARDRTRPKPGKTHDASDDCDVDAPEGWRRRPRPADDDSD